MNKQLFRIVLIVLAFSITGFAQSEKKSSGSPAPGIAPTKVKNGSSGSSGVPGIVPAAKVNIPALDTAPWNTGDTLQASDSGKTFVPVPSGAFPSIMVIPSGLQKFYCSMVNSGSGVDIRSDSGTVVINGFTNTGASFTSSVKFGVVNIREYSPDVYSVTIEPPNEPSFPAKPIARNHAIHGHYALK